MKQKLAKNFQKAYSFIFAALTLNGRGITTTTRANNAPRLMYRLGCKIFRTNGMSNL